MILFTPEDQTPQDMERVAHHITFLKDIQWHGHNSSSVNIPKPTSVIKKILTDSILLLKIKAEIRKS